MAPIQQPIEHTSRVDAENKLWMLQLRKEHAALLEKINAVSLITERYSKLQESVSNMEVNFTTKISNATIKISELEEELRQLKKEEEDKSKLVEFSKAQLQELKQNFIPPEEVAAYEETLEQERAQNRARREAEETDRRPRKTPAETPFSINYQENRHPLPSMTSDDSTMMPQSTPFRDNSPITRRTHPISKPMPTSVFETPANQVSKPPAVRQSSTVMRRPTDRRVSASRDQAVPTTKNGSSSKIASNSSRPAKPSADTSASLLQAASMHSVIRSIATPTLPKFRQNRRGMQNYYELVDKAYAQFQDTDAAFEHAFVDKFVQGFYNDENKTTFLRALMQTHRTARKVDGTIYALCEWKDVAEPLRRCGLLPKKA